MSVVLSAAILSIANIDTMLEEKTHSMDTVQRRIEARKNLHARLETSRALKPQLVSSNDRFRDALTQDEFNEENPYTEISTAPEILGRLMEKGVRSYRRDTYRSPKYKAEFGYDIVSYTVEHMDGSHSSLLAYLEKNEPVIMLMIGGETSADLFVLRRDRAPDHTVKPLTEAQAAMDVRLNESIPFISVSR